MFCQITSPRRIRIVEGGSAVNLEYKPNYPPSTLCNTRGCQVYIDLELEEGLRPR